MRVLSLFSGIGGMDRGLEAAGMRTTQFVEIDEFCRRALQKHWPEVPCHDDIRTYHPAPGEFDLVAGGVPCQPASAAGKRKGQEDSRWLWPEFLRVVREARPLWVLAENVRGLCSLKPTGLGEIVGELEACGYSVWAGVYGAWAVGAPHKRDRVWIVGRLADSAASRRGESEQHDGSRESDAEGSGEPLADPCSSGREPGSEQRRIPDAHGRPEPERSGEVRWPSRPGEPQYEWEPPRVAHAASLCSRPGAQQSAGPDAAGLPSGREVERCVGGNFARVSEWMDGRVLGDKDAATAKTRPSEVVCLLRCPVGEEAIQRHTGVDELLPASEILQRGLYGEAQNPKQPLVGRLTEPHEQSDCIGRQLFGLWDDGEVEPAPSEQRPQRQPPGERGHLVRLASYQASLGRREEGETAQALLRLWRRREAEGFMPETLAEIQEVWRSLADKDRQKASAGIARALNSRLTRHRRAALKAIGNAVVPQCAEVIGRAIMEMECR